MAADDLLARSPEPRPAAEVLDGLGGVLCRCTGYSAIVEAVVARPRRAAATAVPVPAVGARGRRPHRPHRRRRRR